MAMMIKAGKYNKAISLQKQVNEVSDYGAPITSWKTVANVRAAVEPLQGREFFANASVNNENIIRIVFVTALTLIILCA